MAANSRTYVWAALLFGLVAGVATGYLLPWQSWVTVSVDSTRSADEIAGLRAELAALKEQLASSTVEADLKDLQMVVADVMLRGDEVALRAEFARNAARLEGYEAKDFVLRDLEVAADGNLAQLTEIIQAILSGERMVGEAANATSADNASFLGDLGPTDFALDEHAHSDFPEPARFHQGVRVEGDLGLLGNLAASGKVEVFGSLLAVGGVQAGSVESDPAPATAGMIRYNRRKGALEYSNGADWLEIAVGETP